MFLFLLLASLCAIVSAGRHQVTWKNYLDKNPTLSEPAPLKGWFWDTPPTKEQHETYYAEMEVRRKLKLANDLEVDEELRASNAFEQERQRNEFYRKSRDADTDLERAKNGKAPYDVLEKFSQLLSASHSTLETQMNYNRDLNEHLLTTMEAKMAFQLNLLLGMTAVFILLYVQKHRSIESRSHEYRNEYRIDGKEFLRLR
jgi:hypothetical protein